MPVLNKTHSKIIKLREVFFEKIFKDKYFSIITRYLFTMLRHKKSFKISAIHAFAH